MLCDCVIWKLNVSILCVSWEKSYLRITKHYLKLLITTEIIANLNQKSNTVSSVSNHSYNRRKEDLQQWTSLAAPWWGSAASSAVLRLDENVRELSRICDLDSSSLCPASFRDVRMRVRGYCRESVTRSPVYYATLVSEMLEILLAM